MVLVTCCLHTENIAGAAAATDSQDPMFPQHSVEGPDGLVITDASERTEFSICNRSVGLKIRDGRSSNLGIFCFIERLSSDGHLRSTFRSTNTAYYDRGRASDLSECRRVDATLTTAPGLDRIREEQEWS